MARSKSRSASCLFHVLACLLICAVFASELPEQLTLTNDTSNDFSLRPTSLNIRTLSSLSQDSRFFIITAPTRPSWHSLLMVPEGIPLQADSLVILYSVLRT